MIDMRHKPNYLPQLSAPFTEIISGLDSEGVNYEKLNLNPNLLNPSQGVVYSDGVSNVNMDKPIWVDKNLGVLDGHHRFTNAIANDNPIDVIKVDLDHKDACRILNKIQDIYEYKQSNDNITNVVEVITQDVINYENDKDSGVSDSEFLATLEENNINLTEENKSVNTNKIIAYRDKPIKENSVVGNFFNLEPNEKCDKYEIEFDNLLDFDKMGVPIKNSQNPMDILAKIWFPHINFEKLANSYDITPSNLKVRAISERAKKSGYDGIKYGKLVQGFK